MSTLQLWEKHMMILNAKQGHPILPCNLPFLKKTSHLFVVFCCCKGKIWTETRSKKCPRHFSCSWCFSSQRQLRKRPILPFPMTLLIFRTSCDLVRTSLVRTSFEKKFWKSKECIDDGKRQTTLTYSTTTRSWGRLWQGRILHSHHAQGHHNTVCNSGCHNKKQVQNHWSTRTPAGSYQRRHSTADNMLVRDRDDRPLKTQMESP